MNIRNIYVWLGKMFSIIFLVSQYLHQNDFIFKKKWEVYPFYLENT